MQTLRGTAAGATTAPSCDDTTGDLTVRDRRRVLQLALATVWLLDGVLQLQPFMFSSGPRGFSGMLSHSAPGNPGWISSSITWNAGVVGRHAVAANAGFALIQLLLGFGIAWRSTVRPALAASIVWSIMVWWFGEGLGGVLHGAASPLAGGPGPALLYAVLAVLLWPADRPGPTPSFVAARAVGTTPARVVWAVTWVGLGVLGLLGSGRSPDGVHDLVESLEAGQPGWLAAIDRYAASLVDGHGLAVAVGFALVCALVAVGVAAGGAVPERATRTVLLLAIGISLLVWVIGQDVGMILAGGSTDPGSGPLLVLLAASYWPVPGPTPATHVPGSDPVAAAA